MKNLFEQIERELNQKAKAYGIMGTETVTIVVNLADSSEDEIEEAQDKILAQDNHYDYTIDTDEYDRKMMYVSYVEER